MPTLKHTRFELTYIDLRTSDKLARRQTSKQLKKVFDSATELAQFLKNNNIIAVHLRKGLPND